MPHCYLPKRGFLVTCLVLSCFSSCFVPSDWPVHFAANPLAYQYTFFQVAYQFWDVNARLPPCRIMRFIGQAGDIEAETDVLLTTNELNHASFTGEMLECLEPFQDWRISGFFFFGRLWKRMRTMNSFWVCRGGDFASSRFSKRLCFHVRRADDQKFRRCTVDYRAAQRSL